MSCYVEHELPADFAKLPESQAGKARRVCAGCAYELGRKHAADAEERLRERVRALTVRVKELEASSR